MSPSNTSSVACDHCFRFINGSYYHCSQCPDYDVCRDCYDKRRTRHACATPRFLPRSTRPPQSADAPTTTPTNTPPAPAPSRTCRAAPTKPASRVFLLALCDACEQPIFDTRYRCSTCDDFDFCEACHAASVLHVRCHAFYRITSAAQAAAAHPRQDALFPDLAAFEDASPLHRGFVCDACRGPILGTRLHCVHCRSDFCSHHAPGAVTSASVHRNANACTHALLEVQRTPQAVPAAAAADADAVDAEREPPADLPLDFELVDECTVPARPEPGSVFVKCWRVRNRSGVVWKGPLSMAFRGGMRCFDGDAPAVLPVLSDVPADDICQFAVTLRAPQTLETPLLSFWKIVSPDGAAFHKNLCVYVPRP
ncbi:transcription like zf-ZZ type zinc finger protein [Schizosaccharomyces japonicus yFS275]|uniref:Transcription like zf-ZZ type zinc finger protein n=1 Tax=Schizosaccharomyces japonicus (strain yFS275 / FY16936) TaxID=402676 RepID=B6K5K2_SCHJY|nr:transcription like zf-ZZ type zinc finger protein [Schizosaccharomyces japonicus yFS275]EEB08806.2 transcription like zf-ZZ type zinc finger protein [Schizosaccharomyces japonicus yFS275]